LWGNFGNQNKILKDFSKLFQPAVEIATNSQGEAEQHFSIFDLLFALPSSSIFGPSLCSPSSPAIAIRQPFSTIGCKSFGAQDEEGL
jgi:hypothetical protein